VEPSQGAYFLGMTALKGVTQGKKHLENFFKIFLNFFKFFKIPLMSSNARAGYRPGYQKIIKVKIQWVFLFPKHYVLWLGEIPLHNVPSR
jgi:hypothetical protein